MDRLKNKKSRSSGKFEDKKVKKKNEKQTSAIFVYQHYVHTLEKHNQLLAAVNQPLVLGCQMTV
jgi:hypothetical protein